MFCIRDGGWRGAGREESALGDREVLWLLRLRTAGRLGGRSAGDVCIGHATFLFLFIFGFFGGVWVDVLGCISFVGGFGAGGGCSRSEWGCNWIGAGAGVEDGGGGRLKGVYLGGVVHCVSFELSEGFAHRRKLLKDNSLSFKDGSVNSELNSRSIVQRGGGGDVGDDASKGGVEEMDVWDQVG